MSTLGLTCCPLLQKSFRISVSNQNYPVHAETVRLWSGQWALMTTCRPENEKAPQMKIIKTF